MAPTFLLAFILGRTRRSVNVLSAVLRSALITLVIIQALAVSVKAQNAPRLTRKIDDSRFSELPGTTHPQARSANDAGRVESGLAMTRMLLMLSPSDEQQAQLEDLLAAQQDPASAQYHQWLTPQEFGARFGAAQQDVDAVTDWLARKGFQVTQVANGRRAIEFSGTASQVEQAFHTEVHRYTVNGASHLANATNISIPSAMAGVVSGIASLNDFGAAPLHHIVELPSKNTRTAGEHAMLNISSSVHAVVPGDFATIYNVAPLYSAGINGTGQTVAVVGRTNFTMSDVASFRSTFGLPVNNPQIVLNGPNPGIVSQNEEVEALLDTEWSGAIAPNATIKFVLSASTNTTGGETLSAEYIVDNNVAPVLTTSFGACEAQLGSANQLYASLWQQAAAQGISVSVAAGDSGAAGCDLPSSTTPASHGFGVNGIASTPYNTAIGGTQLNDSGSPSAYWSSSNTSKDSSALAYIPELVWNDSAFVSTGSSSNNLYAGSGGVSSLYATPTWQTGAGVPTFDPNTTGSHHRYLPDVSFSAAGHDPYVVILNGGMIGVGGTSAGAPAFAGLMALLHQHLGASVGNPAAALYSMEAKYPTAFHDVVTGTNAVPCVARSTNCNTTSTTAGTLAGWNAGPGFDLATGLGSVNAYNLIMNWPTTTQSSGPAITSLSPNPITGSASAQTLTINGTGFQSGLKVVVTSGTTATTYSGSNVTLTGTTTAKISITTGVAAATWSVQVVNPNSQASNAASLTITAPVVSPVVSSLNPNPMTGSTSAQTLTINGSGFQSGSGLQILFIAPNGATTTVPSSYISYVLASQLQISIVVGTTATNWAVKVVNPGGLTSNAMSFAVTAPVTAGAPAIKTLNPTALARTNSFQTLTLNGTGFQSGSGLQIVISYPGGSITVPSGAISFVSSTQLQLSLNVGTTARTMTFQVVNPNGQTSNTVAIPVQ